MPPALNVAPEIAYVGLLFGLFVVPRVLQRLGVPTAITGFALGAVAGMAFGLFKGDQTIALLATFGIVSLFLFAGLEVDFHDLRAEASILLQHLVVRLVTLALVAGALVLLLALEVRAALLVALALLTPSAGFILDSLDRLKLSARERFWIRSKAIATELVALAVLFVTMRSASVANLALSTLALAALIGVLPWVFRGFARLIVPHAPRAEFAFLMMVAVVCALATRKLGVYYLVGAFVVGLAAQRLRERLPSMSSERMLHAVEAFASLFVPFYFFHAGLKLRPSDFGLAAVLAGALFLVTVIPLRLALVALHRRLALGEPLRASLRVGVPMMPTLVFTLVLVGILRERFAAPSYLVGGLIIFTVVNTILPSLLHRAPPPEYDALEAPAPGLHAPESAGAEPR